MGILTNANLLRCSRCSNYISCYPSCFSNVTYQGHYILVVGFDPKSREILYRNPTLKDKICYISYGAFEDARTAYGTDEDTIFIYKHFLLSGQPGNVTWQLAISTFFTAVKVLSAK